MYTRDSRFILFKFATDCEAAYCDSYFWIFHEGFYVKRTFFKTNILCGLRSGALLFCTGLTVQSAASQWGGSGPRFEPGTGNQRPLDHTTYYVILF